ncbi:MAG: thioredoxin [Pseudomonadota bacterium]
MGSIAARALGRGGTDRAEPAAPESLPEQSRGSSIRRRLAAQNEATPSEGEARGASTEFDEDALAAAFDDPASEGSLPGFEPGSEATPFDDDFEDPFEDPGYEEEDTSQFEYRAPFTARRNPVKMWTAAAAIFALMATGTVLAVNYYGLPEWLPFSRPAFGVGKPDLVLNFAKAEQREIEEQPGVAIFQVRGSIDNVGRETVSIPQLVVVFKDEAGSRVFSKAIVPAKSELAPGESLKVTEGISGYPDTAKTAGIGWSPN